MNEPIADALQWWLEEQGKFDGARVRTREVSPGNFEIVQWVVDGVNEPTENELTTIVSDYRQAEQTERANFRGQRTALLARLRLDNDDVRLLKKVLKDA